MPVNQLNGEFQQAVRIVQPAYHNIITHMAFDITTLFRKIELEYKLKEVPPIHTVAAEVLDMSKP